MGRTKHKFSNGRVAVVVALIMLVSAVVVEVIRWLSSIDARRSAEYLDSKPPPKGKLRITNLPPGGYLVVDPIVEGDASGSIEQVWLLIQTREMPPKCWIHGPAGLDENRKWHIPAQFGRSRSLDSGARFSVSAIAGPPNDTKPGVVSCTLAPAVRSPSVEVTRQSGG